MSVFNARSPARIRVRRPVWTSTFPLSSTGGTPPPAGVRWTTLSSS